MKGLAALLLLGLLIFWLIGVAWTLFSLTRPPRKTYASAVRRGLPGDPGELDEPLEYAEWTFTSRGRQLSAWDIKAMNPDGPVAVMTHGWGSSKRSALGRMQPMLPFVSRIIAWDQPGHGDSPGSCDLGVGEAEDLIALIEHTDPKQPVILFGWSMGSGVSIAAGAELGERVRAIIAEAPYRLAYTPARNVVDDAAMPWRVTLWPGFMLMGLLRKRSLKWAGQWIHFDRAEHAEKLACPLLVVHGTEDTTCPVEDGREIAQAAPEGTFVPIDGAGHNDLWSDDAFRAQISGAMRDFLANVLGASGPGAEA